MNDSLKDHVKKIAVLVGTVLLVVVAYTAYEYLYHTLPPKQVDIAVSYLPDSTCREDSPIYMLIKNDSYREITSTSFSLSVKKEINSNNSIQLLEKSYFTDKIIKAGESYVGCWPYPKLNTDHYVPEKLMYEINSKQVAFRD